MYLFSQFAQIKHLCYQCYKVLQEYYIQKYYYICYLLVQNQLYTKKKSISRFNLLGKLNQEPTNKEIIDLKLFVQYRAFKNIFSKTAADKLLFYYIYNYKIKLENSSEFLGFCLLYQQTTKELLATKKYITEYLSKGFIKSSQTLFAISILFI